MDKIMASHYWIIIFILQTTVHRCFLLDTSNSTTTFHLSTEVQQVLALFHEEKQNLTNYVSVLEQKLNVATAELKQQINITEQEVIKLNTELQNEISRRMQLQKDNDALTIKLYDLSINYNKLNTKVGLLQGENVNLKNLAQNLTTAAGDIDIAAIDSNLTQFLEFKKKQDYTMEFTVTNPKNGTSSGTLSFQSVVSNTGSQYNISTGKFTCAHDGIYFFSLTIVKMDSADHAWCYIRKNDQQIVQAGVDPPGNADFGWYGATNSALLHLHIGDFVDIGGCSPANTVFSDTSFSGFLVKAL